MCGIVGVVGDIGQDEKKAFNMLLQLDTIRGPHSTGVVRVNAVNSAVDYEKYVGTPWEFFMYSKMCDGRTNLVDGNLKLLFGHNRYATAGAVTDENAHPFDTEKVIGVHNGTLDWGTQSDIDPKDEYAVDSEALYNLIDQQGIRKAISQCNGAWSLVWYNKETNELQLLRNKERPMYYAYSKNEKTVFFASEGWMIQVACSKYNIPIEEVLSTIEDTHYFIDLSPTSFYNKKVSYSFSKQLMKGAPEKKFIRTPVLSGKTGGNSGGKANANTTFIKKHTPNSKQIVGSEEQRETQAVMDTLKNEAGQVEVFCKEIDNTLIMKEQYVIMRTCEMQLPVKMWIGTYAKGEKDAIVNSKNKKYFVKVNNWSWATTGSGDSIYCATVQYNSLMGPYEWPAGPVKMLEDKSDPKNKIIENEVSNIIHLRDAINKKPPIRFTVEDDLDAMEDDIPFEYEESNEQENEDWHKTHWIKTYNNTYVTTKEFNNLMRSGCSKCQINWLSPDASYQVDWLSYTEFLCPTCSGYGNKEGIIH